MYRLLLPLLFVFFLFQSLAGQNNYKELSKKDKEKFKSAQSAHKQKKVDEALKQYCKLLNKYSGHPEVELWAGLAFKDKGKLDEALPYLIRATSNNTSENTLLYSTIAEVYRAKKNYGSSKEYYSLFLEKTDTTSPLYEKGQNLYNQVAFIENQINNPVAFDPKPLDFNVNTLYSEYLPQFTADHQTLFFTRRSQGQEDIYLVEKSDDGMSESMYFDVVNTERYNEGAHCISADGNTFIFTKCDDKSGIGGCDLYITRKKEGRWSKPQNMGTRLNTVLWESQPSLSGDGNILFFSSTRKGGLGGKDIWYSVFGKSGYWSSPKNAGNTINTEKDESSPFLHADKRSLYFRSNGHLGMGGFDIFMSRRKDKGQWTKPHNLGYPINTEGEEGALTISLDGTKGYYATDHDGESVRNNLDIYEFELPQEIRPSPYTFIKIKSIDAESKNPLTATLDIVDISTNTRVSSKKANFNGEVLLPIPIKKEMLINVQMEGYTFFSDNIILDSITHGMDPYVKTIELIKLPKENTTTPTSTLLVLNNILFESGTAELKKISMVELDQISKMLSDNPKMNLKITGHTDNVGHENDNLILSQKRALSVKKALVSLGINGAKITTAGKGESTPISENDSAEGRRKNRRTEFEIYYL